MKVDFIDSMKEFGRSLVIAIKDSLHLYLYGLLAALAIVAISAFSSYAHNVEATIHSVTINPQNKKELIANVSSEGDTSGTDGRVYLFEIKPYQQNLAGRDNPITSISAGQQQMLSFSLDAGPGEKRLYSSFVAAVKVNGRYEIVSDRHYITNPEQLSTILDPAVNNGKKGLRINPNLLGDALELNIKHAGVDIATQQFFGNGISYYYEGKTFDINAQLIQELDREISLLSNNGITVTAILLNGWNTAVPELNRPGVTELPADKAQYYGFNVETETGFRAVKAMASYLAHRYNGKNGVGKITNWVIGNEINNQYWNYMGDYDVSTYVHKFQETFRPFYTAIKSECANDNVMFSIDYYWNMEPEGVSVGKYRARDVLDNFNYWDITNGQIDWGLALHPYPYPLNDPKFWNDEKSGKVNQTVDSPIVNFANLHVITDYMQNPMFLRPNGAGVRTIFLTEEGFTATSEGQDRQMDQAAAVAYSYYIADNNPFISAYLMSRQEDSIGEGMVGLNFGLSYFFGGMLIHRTAWDIFRLVDDPSVSLQVTEFAKPIIGINDWNEVIPGFRAPGQH